MVYHVLFQTFTRRTLNSFRRTVWCEIPSNRSYSRPSLLCTEQYLKPEVFNERTPSVSDIFSLAIRPGRSTYQKQNGHFNNSTVGWVISEYLSTSRLISLSILNQTTYCNCTTDCIPVRIYTGMQSFLSGRLRTVPSSRTAQTRLSFLVMTVLKLSRISE